MKKKVWIGVSARQNSADACRAARYSAKSAQRLAQSPKLAIPTICGGTGAFLPRNWPYLVLFPPFRPDSRIRAPAAFCPYTSS